MTGATGSLVVLNGPPGVGKSTLAHRYAADHPLCLVLDIDLLRAQLSGWRDDATAAGLAARELAVGMARTHLRTGRDVVVPQLLADRTFAARLHALGAVEVLLWCPLAEALRRFRSRADADPDAPQDADEVVTAWYEALSGLCLPRVESVPGDVAATYHALLAAL